MGASAKKALKKELNKILSSTPLTDKQKSSSGFLLLQVYAIPREHVYPKLWKGFDYCYNPVCRHQIERKQQNQVGDVQSVPDKIKFNLE